MASSLETYNEYHVRPVSRDDSRRIWEIRNHPDVRVHTNNPEEFAFESHDQWFKRQYFGGKKNVCHVLKTVGDARVIGYCRYDFNSEQNHYVVSIALDPAHHGQGLGHLLLSESLAQLGKGKTIWAEIKHENIRSLKLFEKNHFVKIGGDERHHFFVYKPEL